MDIIALIFVIVFGLIIGSFLNVVIWRIPRNESIVAPPSHCPNCNHNLKWFENIPLFSYLLLAGKCKQCKQKISIRYPLVELLNAVLWTLVFVAFWEQNIIYSLVLMPITTILLIVFWIDIDHKLIFDRFIIIMLILCVPLIIFDKNLVWYEHLIGCVVGGGMFATIYYLSIWIMQREGMGGGDVKLMAVLGLMLGWKNVILTIVVASILATIVLGIYALIKKSERKAEFPFAPFLIVGSLISLFLGDTIINAYFSLF